MATNTASELCRLTVVAPSGMAEVALPADVPLADLLPTLVKQAGGDLPDAGLIHDGWVLQRLGGPPLDEDQTPAGLALRDGETVYLRPRQAALPTIDFDDLVDGVSTGVRDRADRWRGGFTRAGYLGVMLAALGLGLGVLLLPGPTGTRAGVAGAVAVLLLAGAAAASRAAGDAVAGAGLGVAAVLYAALCGLLAPGLPAGAAGLRGLLAGPNVLAAGVAAVAAAVLALLLVGVVPALFLGLLVTAGGVAGGGVLAAAADRSAAQAAAAVAVVALAGSAAAPITAFRLARFVLPPLPSTAEELQQDVDPLPGESVLARTAVADRYLTALFGAVGLLCAGCLTVLAGAAGWAPRTLAAAICVALLLRSRVLVSGWQRLVALVPAVYGLATLALAVARDLPVDSRAPAGVGLLVVLAGLCLAGAHLLPGRRMTPLWGRAGDILETLVAASLIPLALAVLGLFAYVRSLGG
ncbi:MAG TPA: type VII secretion integral membrane protein EccD [Mycobacteriales bacterium]|nr:type VII secretion integral membrane protein EccD [Mycobacteriales bacterium]